MRTTEQNREELERMGEPDFEELWLDQDISAEELLELDPMEITQGIIEMAEHPELADPVIAAIRDSSPRRGDVDE